MSNTSNTQEISLLQEATERLHFERGPVVKFWHDCLLERVSAQNPEYIELVRSGNEFKRTSDILRAQAFLYQDAEWIQAQILRPVMVTGDEQVFPRLPNEEELRQRNDEIQRTVDQLVEDLKAADQNKLQNQAARIAYLTKDWSWTSEGKPLAISPENVLKYYSETLLDIVLKKIESGVFGPLVIQSDSTA